jgi:hypothetical protein
MQLVTRNIQEILLQKCHQYNDAVKINEWPIDQLVTVKVLLMEFLEFVPHDSPDIG